MKARENPFATSRIMTVRYRLRGISWDQLLCRLRSLGYWAAIVGPHGAGKTTLLEDLEPPLQAGGFQVHRLRLDAESRCFPRGFTAAFFRRLGTRDCVLLDGAEQLGWLGWRRFKREARRVGGLLITTHAPGLLPTLWECQTDAELLAGIVGDLSGCQTPEVPTAWVSELFQRHRGNLRDALRELYDRHALSGKVL